MNTEVSVLVVEDNPKDCELLKEYFVQKDGAKLVAMTNSSVEAIEYVKSHSPEGVILDIELNYGVGSGDKFLEELQALKIPNKPIVVVLTNIECEIAQASVRKSGASTIVYKGKEDAFPEAIDRLVKLVHTVRRLKNQNGSAPNIDTEAMKKERLERKILQELEIIGISDNLKGKRYLFEAIYYLIENDVHDVECRAMKMLESKHKKTHSNLVRVMQTAIHNAWRKSEIETLQKQYTAVVCHNSGVPTVNEFIYYYANKIHKLVS
ncbi:MAG: response regulator [Oscillospiraceae bacterium]|nr:response regulator [Oscillospiraceae bacterium]